MSGEGWALTRDDRQFHLGDDSPVLRILDPATLDSVGSIMVAAGGVPVTDLNRAGMGGWRDLANVWLTNRIARVDPANGHVPGWIDLTGRFDVSTLPVPMNDVLDAWGAQQRRPFVTGKHWPKPFDLSLTGHPRKPHLVTSIGRAGVADMTPEQRTPGYGKRYTARIDHACALWRSPAPSRRIGTRIDPLRTDPPDTA